MNKLFSGSMVGMNPEQNEILRALRAFPVGEIYRLSPKSFILRGFGYYQDGRLRELRWSQDQETLIAKVQGSQLYTVEISRVGTDLFYDCTCPVWSPEEQCKHVVCTLFTLKNLLDPDLFHIPARKQHRNRLITALKPTEISGQEPPAELERADYSLVLNVPDYSPGFFDLEIRRNGIHVFRPTPDLPMDLQPVLRETQSYYGHSEKSLLQLLRGNAQTPYPIRLQIRKKVFPLQWDSTRVYTSRTVLNAADGMITLMRLCLLDDVPCPQPYLLGEHLVADLETGKLGILNDRSGWAFYELLQREWANPSWIDRPSRNFSTDDFTESGPLAPLNLPTPTYQEDPFMIPSDEESRLSDLQLTVDHRPTPLKKTEQDVCMVIESHEAYPEMMTLKLCNTLGNLRGPTTPSFFENLYLMAVGQGVSLPLKAWKRRKVLVEAYFKLMAENRKGKAEAVIRESLSDPEFRKRKVKAEARSLLTRALVSLERMSSRLPFSDGSWYLIRNHPEQETLLYTIAYEVFGPELFKGMIHHHTFLIPSGRLFSRLTELFQRCLAEKIPLFVKGKPVQVSRWEISVEARRGAGIDWFEIRPEIRCNGKLMDEQTWKRILTRDGLVEGDDMIRILDPDAREILEAIASLYPKTGKSSHRLLAMVPMPRLQIIDWLILRKKGVRITLPQED